MKLKDIRDFPDFLSPVIVKELRQGVRARSFLIPFIVVQVAMVTALGFDGFARPADHAGSHSPPGAGPGMHSPSLAGMLFFGFGQILPNQNAFWTFLFPLMILAVPYRGLQAINSEKDERNGELILLTRLTRWKLVMGKWLALNALGLVTLISCVPYLLARYFLGGMNVPVTILLLGIVALANTTANAFAIGISGFSIGQRILLLFFGSIAMAAGSGIGLGGIGMLMALWGSSEFDLVAALVTLGGLTTISLFYSMSWLQVGRAKLRLFEDPIAGSASGSMLTLFFCSPVILGAFAAMTLGYGVIPAFLVMTWVVTQVDPAPKLSKAVPYAGAYSH